MRIEDSPEFEDRELVGQLSELKNIRPREEWVLLTRSRLFQETQSHAKAAQGSRLDGVFAGIEKIALGFRALAAKPAFVMPLLAVVVFGGMIAQLAQKSLPGDRLYALRSTTERWQYGITLENRASAQLELAQARLQDLRRIAQDNKVRNLDSAIKEFEQTVAQASKEVDVLIQKGEPEQTRKVSEQIAKLGKAKAEVELILGVQIGEEESANLESATKRLAEYELADLALRTLTEEQQELLEAAEIAFNEGEYQQALEYIFEIGSR
ncbi:MAG: DUF5667 domain-containing protein [Candidatus Yanofskybacteria bacterium]|nr:DUF5667 domain-containing protein [Candidatus Yanofskybacteria bacterium]